MYPSIKAVLPKSSIAANISKEIRDSIIASAGAGALFLFNYQGNSRTSMMVEQVNRKTPTEVFLLTYIEYRFLEAGV